VTTDNKTEIYIVGKVLECIPSRRLVLSWPAPDDVADKSRIAFEIKPFEDMVPYGNSR